jgi:hypothetical protein
MNLIRCAIPWLRRANQLAFCSAMIVFLAATCKADPIVYSAFTIIDGQLGSWKFHDARVLLTFHSQTQNVQQLNVQGIDVAFDDVGSAQVTIATPSKTVHAVLSPGQIFVSFDKINAGVGIGFLSPGVQFPANLNPIYPLAVDGGLPLIAVHFGILPDDLLGDAGFAGLGLSCLSTSPFTTCGAPASALKTDKGDLYLYPAYTFDLAPVSGISMNTGFFFQEQGSGKTLRVPNDIFSQPSATPTGTITYNLFLVSDVSIGGQLLQNASIHLSFSSNISHVRRDGSGLPKGYINDQGTARVVATDGSTTIRATFAPGQIYVYFDPSLGSAGFGSVAGGRSYPAVLGSTSEFNLLQAVSDILRNQVLSGLTYSPQTQTLAKISDLKHAMVLADVVQSCTSSPGQPYCSSPPTATKLTTDKGDFYLYEPYAQYTIGWGNSALFWSTP